VPILVEIGQTAAEIWLFLNFSKMAVVRHLGLFFHDGGRPPSWIFYVCSDHPRRAFGGLYHCARFGWNRCSEVMGILRSAGDPKPNLAKME